MITRRAGMGSECRRGFVRQSIVTIAVELGYLSKPNGFTLPMTEEQRLKKNERVRELNFRRYRLAHGIPLDAPLSKRGVKRGTSRQKESLPPLKYYWQ